MHSFYKLITSRINLLVLALALTTVLIFSSWGKAPRYTSLRELAGAAAFKTTAAQHTIKLNGRDFPYTATMGYIAVSSSSHHSAQVFYTAYTTGQTNRPLTFIFNGGPGSSSIWLHMGSFGPVRAVPGKAGYTDNPNTWLNFTNLVFIDPAGTGYSRPDDGTDARRFYGYRQDVRAIASFIKQYIAENNRTNSPVFLAGESYGAARAVGLAAYLRDSVQTPVSGLTLISPALNYRLINFGNGNDTPYTYYLPAYAATAQYHHRLAAQLQALSATQLQAQVTRFAFGTYSRFLSDGKNSESVLDTLSYYTGIDKATLRVLNGRISDTRFTRLLLKGDNKQTGTYDSRISGLVLQTDPSEVLLRKTFPQAFQQYRRQIAYHNNLPYLATIATPQWNYGPAATKGYLNVIPLLKQLLQENAQLKVHFVSGNYDLATPPATVDAAVTELKETNNTNGQLSIHHYRAGHMLYTDDKTNAQWRKDSEVFYKNAIPARI